MVLELHPMVETDFDDFARISRSSFQGGIADLLTLGDLTPEVLASTRDRHLGHFRDDPHSRYVKVVDSDTKAIVAVAYWEIRQEERPMEQFLEDTGPVPIPPTAHPEAWEEFFGYLTHARRNVMGNGPIAFLHLLTTHPDYQRRGAGAIIMKWGCEQADKYRVRAFLEASQKGKGLYEKFGFKEVERKVFDLSKWGGDSVDIMTLMFRDAEPVPS
ncbi:acyl-CoA N-acyltransferase [Eremomyces bilateralis CBS 781.70]|uniref:Acyl-CoA N-acyltransferase n=1 Tax=Eremomyces bilateralis CBS 781.70 TaxID=1392243 RepID=A0A6G1GCU0_9PEZI|nr:acyl-CoA N-acyltransferase [Eremomyces bilateralis CBS 781.70]KAF1815908.1 acyl-CoA N-acyltransferase [Eremomyces bilateralis CBS 781.70]